MMCIWHGLIMGGISQENNQEINSQTMFYLLRARRISPPDPKVNFPPRGKRTQLWKKSKDLDVLDNEFEAKKDDFKITSEELSKTMEMGGQTDRYEKIQPDKPNVNEEII